MVIKEAIDLGRDALKDSLYTDPVKESRNILSFLLDVDLTFILLNPTYELEESVAEKFREIIKKRREGTPLDYILNESNFYGRDFYVDSRALIPRWDTENLVEEVIDFGKTMESPEILELGAGSGAISLTISLELPQARVTAVDISEAALEVCRINKERYKEAKVDFIQSNLFENIKSKYDIIVSNPPYIKSGDMDFLQAEVKKEPRLALDGGEDGLDFYREIIKTAKAYLKDGGFLVFEIGADQAHQVSEIFNDYGYKNIGYKKDLQGFIRVIWALKEEENVREFTSI